MTAHNSANKDDIAKTVIMPGDPKRAKLIAETYLEDIKLVNDVRGILAFTGTYNDKKITIMASGMGIPSMGIYATELFNDYDVEQIIRIGTCGSLSDNLKVKDIVLVKEAYTTSNFAYELTGNNTFNIKPNEDLLNSLRESAKMQNIEINEEKIITSDIYYREFIDESITKEECKAVEMETFALLYLGKHFNKKAASVLTVSDNPVTKDSLSSDEREKCFDKAMKIILKSL